MRITACWEKLLRYSITLVMVLSLWTLTATSAGEEEAPEPLRVLQLTGGGWHDYETQQYILSDGVEERINATVDTLFTDAPEEDLENQDWIEGYDAVLHNHGWSYLDPEVQAHMAEVVSGAHAASQAGAVLLHNTMATFRDAPEWFEFTGVDMYHHEPQYPFTVLNFREDHPLMADFGTEWETPAGELYNINSVLPNTSPLAIAYGRERSEEYEIVIWTREYEGVPVFATTIGHHNETMEDPVYLDLVARGVLYVTGKLGEDGQPVEGYGAE